VEGPTAVALLSGLLAPCLLMVAHGSPARAELAKSVLPVHLHVPFVAPPFTSEGVVGLAYELYLSSLRDVELVLEEVEVFAPEDPSRSLFTLAGADLLKCLLRPGRSSESGSPEVLRGGEFAVVPLWVRLGAGLPAPESLAHRATFRLVRSDGSEQEYTVEGGTVRVPPRDRIVLAPPLPAGRWLMANGPSMLGDHRLFLHALDGTASNTQRFASDWMLLGPDGCLVRGDPRENEDWYAHGVPVLAVADAVVVHIADGLPENVPLSDERAVPNKRDTMTGNCVVLQLTDDRFAFYGHLQPGSLLVRVGDRVHAGQELARIGNSGNSDAPHLHFHVANGPDPLSGEGVPFAFTSFVLLDALDVPSWERMLEGAVAWEQPADRRPVLRANEMPLGESIVEFR